MNLPQEYKVIVRLTGGLGNQMFQYAAASRIAIHNNALLQIDLSWYDQRGDWTPRRYELDEFKIPVEFATQKEVKDLLSIRKSFFLRGIAPFLKSRMFNTNQAHIIEKDFAFDPDILSVTGNIYLDGYWQSYKYFEDVDETIRKDFCFRAGIGSNSRQVEDMIKSCEAVSLHIRRGDYVTLTSASTYHGLCSLQYYEKAASIIKERLNNPVVFVFSDDIQWAKDHLKFDMPIFFVDYSGTTAHMDMYLMSLCRHHIIANSSFSWWGAWLNQSSDKIVITPKQWFKDESINTADLIPESWVRI